MVASVKTKEHCSLRYLRNDSTFASKATEAVFTYAGSLLFEIASRSSLSIDLRAAFAWDARNLTQALIFG